LRLLLLEKEDVSLHNNITYLAQEQQVERLQTQVADIDSMKDTYQRLKEENEKQARQNELLIALILAASRRDKAEASRRLRASYGIDGRADFLFEHKDLELHEDLHLLVSSERCQDFQRSSGKR
jgi:hypothetical protein